MSKTIFKNNIGETFKIDIKNNVEYYKCSNFLETNNFPSSNNVELKCDSNTTLSPYSKLFDNNQIDPSEAWTYSSERIDKINANSDYYESAYQTNCKKLDDTPTEIAQISGNFYFIFSF